MDSSKAPNIAVQELSGYEYRPTKKMKCEHLATFIPSKGECFIILSSIGEDMELNFCGVTGEVLVVKTYMR